MIDKAIEIRNMRHHHRLYTSRYVCAAWWVNAPKCNTHIWCNVCRRHPHLNLYMLWMWNREVVIKSLKLKILSAVFSRVFYSVVFYVFFSSLLYAVKPNIKECMRHTLTQHATRKRLSLKNFNVYVFHRSFFLVSNTFDSYSISNVINIYNVYFTASVWCMRTLLPFSAFFHIFL